MDETAVETAAPEGEAPELPDCHPGVEDGYVDANGERVVHIYEDGELVGWYKEPAE